MVGLGTNNFGWRIGLEESRAVIDAALDEGITLLDTADVYGAHRERDDPRRSPRRAARQLPRVTKFGHPVPGAPDGVPRTSRAYIRWAVEGSLARLRTDVIDIYMLHKPDG